MYGILICTALLLWWWWYRRPQGSPPGPRGIPLLGMMPFIGRRPEVTFNKWSKIYGDVMYVRIGTEDSLILNGIEAIQEALVKQGRKFEGRPINYVCDHIMTENRDGVVLTDGEHWRSQRKFGTSTLRGFGVGKRSFEDRVREEASFYLKVIEENENKPYNPYMDLLKPVSNIIYSVAFGYRFDYGEEKIWKLNLPLYKMVSDPNKSAQYKLVVLLPFLRFFPPFKTLLDEQRKDESKSMITNIIRDHRATLDPANIRDFIDAYLVEMDQQHSPYFTETQLMYYIRDLVFAAVETTSSSLRWCFLSFLHFPYCQEKIQAEIDDVIGDEGVPAMKHRDHMPFTNAFLQEIQRFCTLAPLSLPHCTTEDAVLNGYKIPKRTQVLVNLWSVHNDPKLFENPEEFRPERFLDEEGRFFKSKNVIPFSVGPRKCLGEQLGRMELFIFLTTIFQRYNIEPDPLGVNQLPMLNDGVLGMGYVPRQFSAVFKAR